MRSFLPGRETLEMFADLLGYPRGTETDAAARGVAALCGDSPEAAALLKEVRSFFAETSRERAEEIFTATFDLQAACAPYLGFHLFGEGYKRRLFLAGLSAIYSSRGFPTGGELPDHIAVVLRFLASSPPGGPSREIVEDGLIPALSKMIGKFGDAGNPYENVLRALQGVLLARQGEETVDAKPRQPGTGVGAP